MKETNTISRTVEEGKAFRLPVTKWREEHKAVPIHATTTLREHNLRFRRGVFNVRMMHLREM